MKVFLSWSGELSHRLAVLLRDWLPSVIQSLEPYVSSEDIDKGARWSTDIAKELEVAGYGILCVTRENVEAPWLNFEAGALSKSVDKGRVSPLLCGVKRSEIKSGPLLQFQSTIAEREDVKKLLQSINLAIPQGGLDEARLATVFDVWWPKLDEQLKQLEATAVGSSSGSGDGSSSTRSQSQADILEQVLELVRQQNRVLNDPMSLLPPAYLDGVIGRRSDRLEGHPVFDDLAERWISVRDILMRVREDGIQSTAPLFLALDRLADPIDYIVDRYSRTTVRRKRRLMSSPDNPG